MTTPAAPASPEVPASLLEIIVCPADHGDLVLDAGTAGAAGADPAPATLTCQTCGLVYPVRDGIPVLLVDEARRPG